MTPEGLLEENKRLEKWIDDLQSGMYINCVYCGHRYGPSKSTPTTMRKQLYNHISECPKHPLSIAIADAKAIEEELADYKAANASIREELRCRIKERDKLEAENKRLGEALDRIESMATIENTEIQKIAREALKEANHE